MIDLNLKLKLGLVVVVVERIYSTALSNHRHQLNATGGVTGVATGTGAVIGTAG